VGLKSIVKSHGSIFFQPFDKEGLRGSPLKLKVHASASFRMQPCRFIRDGILTPLKTMLDQFVSEGVLISDSSCDFESPLVFVNKKDGGIRMAVDYHEVNMQLEATANQLPYQPTLFQRLGDNVSMRRWTIFGDIINYVSQKIVPKLPQS